MEVIVHGSGTGAPLVIEVEETARVAELKAKLVEAGWPAERTLVSLTLQESEQELPDGSTLLDLEIHAGTRLVGHDCRRIAVSVTYNNETKHRDFHGSAIVGTVLRWALHEFKIDPSEIGDFELQYDEPPITAPDDTPLADLQHECRIKFSLVRSDFHKG
jgi:hypothetical protein